MGTKRIRSTLTRDKLLDSARELFAKEWYETVSVSRICSNAGLSNGIFYSYFRRKEEIFKELLSCFLDGFRRDLEQIEGAGISERLEKMLDVIIRAGVEYRDLVTIFREGQYRFPEYERMLRDLYVTAVYRVYNRKISEAEYLFVISGIRFISIRSIYNAFPVNLAVVRDYIEHGFFSAPGFRKELVFSASFKELDSLPADDSRGKIKEAATKLFGERGFYNVHVFEIAALAGFSVGTFYIYFESKDACLAEIVHDIGRNTRRFISLNLDPSLNRLERELQGMHLFLTYFGKNIHFYGIVREAEFVVNPAVTTYYNAFERGYLRSVEGFREGDPPTAANMLMGISHYLGIEVFFSDRIPDSRELITRIGALLNDGIQE